MAKINLLDIQVANLIAAGEVVERPASALKEIVENSIDAGATVITVEIKNGGVSYIRVTDNGEGMTAEDLGRCILRHATSKIENEKDLRKIKTLGFRGEALAAISSVADMKIFSKHRDSEQGYILEVSHGYNTRMSEAGCAYGTTVVIEHLFRNIPARQKFLKRDATEGMYCKSVVEKIALSNPFVSLRFIQDNKERLFTPGGGSYRNAVYSIYKDEIGDRLILIREINAEDSESTSSKFAHIKISGFLSRFEDCKNTRSDENFFVNGRYVRSKTILSAVEGAYDSVCETGKFPLCVLYVTIDESTVDINVHPQKLEVKFANEHEVFEAVYFAVKNTLERDDILGEISEEKNIGNAGHGDKSAEAVYDIAGADAKMQDRDKEDSEVEVVCHNFESLNRYMNIQSEYNDADSEEKYYIYTEYEDKVGDKEDKRSEKDKNTVGVTVNTENRSGVKSDDTEDNIYNISARETDDIMLKGSYKFIGEVFYGYIIIEKGDRVVIIDKHAAHERLIYDTMIEKARNSAGQDGSQLLITPVEIRLNSEETAGILEFKEEIEKMGLIFEVGVDNADSNTVVIKGVPSDIADVNIEDIFREMAYMISGEGNRMAHENALEKFVEITAKKTSACRLAMKNGIRDEPEHLMWLAERTMNYEIVKYCPHGRPLAFEVTKRQLERQFGR